MLLALDIGNTRTTVGGMTESELLFQARLETRLQKTAEEYALDLRALLSFYVPEETVTGAIVSSVVPALTDTLAAALRLVTGAGPLVVGPGVRTGLNITIDNPSQLGSDLAVCAVAAVAEYSVPLIVVDLGTATVFSVVDGSRRFRGGMIAPGLRAGLDALRSRTAQLPDVPVRAPEHTIGTNTADCIRSGAVLGTACMVDGLCGRVEEELGESVRVIATGDMAGVIAPCCRRAVTVDEDLVLKGLRLIWRKNRGSLA